MAYLASSQIMDYANVEKRRHPAIFHEAPSSAQLGPDRLDEIYLNQLRAARALSRYTELEQAFTSLRDQLSALYTLRPGWDSYHAPVPNAFTIESAERALNVLRRANAKPTAVLPAADGGVGICFVEKQRYAHIEFANDEEVWVLMYGPTGSPESWRLPSSNVDAIGEAWSRISAYLQY
jgi:hypothetical protein